MISQLIMVIHFVVAFSLITLVLLQHGKGADVGAAFGSGASNTFFGSQGSGGFMYRATWILALIFCITSISLTYYATKANSVGADIPQQLVPAAPKESTSGVPLKTQEAPAVPASSSSKS